MPPSTTKNGVGPDIAVKRYQVQTAFFSMDQYVYNLTLNKSTGFTENISSVKSIQ